MEPCYEKVTRTDHPTCPEQRLMLRPLKSIPNLICLLGPVCRAVHLQSRLKIEGKTLTHSQQDEAVGSAFSWRQPLLTMQFNKQFRECDDLVFLECKEHFNGLDSAPAGQQVARSVMRAAGRSSHFDVTSHSTTLRPYKSASSREVRLQCWVQAEQGAKHLLSNVEGLGEIPMVARKYLFIFCCGSDFYKLK